MRQNWCRFKRKCRKPKMRHKVNEQKLFEFYKSIKKLKRKKSVTISCWQKVISKYEIDYQ